MVSAAEETGLTDAWDAMSALTTWRKDNGWFEATRKDQARYWFGESVRLALLSVLERAEVAADMRQVADEVAQGRDPTEAAQDFVARLG